MKEPTPLITLLIAASFWLIAMPAAEAAQSISLSWDPAADAAGYFVNWSTNGFDDRSWRVDTGTNSQITLEGLTEGTICYVSVAAYSSDGAESLPSTTAILVPGAIQIDLSSVRVSLRVSAAASTVYDVQATDDFARWTIIGQVAAGSNDWINFVDPDAKSQQRFYRITPHF